MHPGVVAILAKTKERGAFVYFGHMSSLNLHWIHMPGGTFNSCSYTDMQDDLGHCFIHETTLVLQWILL